MSEAIHVRPWSDPIIDTLGHDPRSIYVETFWLPTLGPTSLLLLRHLASRFDEISRDSNQPTITVTLPIMETSLTLGIGPKEGNHSPLRRTFARLEQFDLARPDGQGAIAVRRNVPPINRRHVRRLPPLLQTAHDEWINARLADPPFERARRNARRMAFTLLELSKDLGHIERALAAAGFHPSICRESATWAWQRHEQRASTLAPDDLCCSA